MKEWLTPVLVILGLVLVGFGIRAVIVKRSANKPSGENVLGGAQADGENAPGPDGQVPSGSGDEQQPRDDPSTSENWEDDHHPVAAYPPEPGSAAEIKLERAKGKAEHPPDDMVSIAAGDFTMGDASLPGAGPAHIVHVKAFKIDRYEVTNRRYAEFIKQSKYPQPERADEFARDFSWREKTYPPGTGDHPVVLVTYKDAQAFCKWDENKRLPTEAEWEKAARGPKSSKYPWGNQWDGRKANTVERLSGPLKAPADYTAFVEKLADDVVVRPFPIGSYPEDKSSFGVMDMHGNVGEWVDDAFEPYDGGDKKARKAFGMKDVAVVRGTSYAHRDYAAPSATRFPYKASHSDTMIGFRCARDF